VTSSGDFGWQNGILCRPFFFLTLQAVNLWLNASPCSLWPNIFTQGDCFNFLGLFMYFIQPCFICRPSDSTVSKDAGIVPRNCCDIGNWQSYILTTRLDLIHKMTFLYCQKKNLSIFTLVGGNHSRKEPFEQLVYSDSEILHISVCDQGECLQLYIHNFYWKKLIQRKNYFSWQFQHFLNKEFLRKIFCMLTEPPLPTLPPLFMILLTPHCHGSSFRGYSERFCWAL
jgi:hypothetical protein